MKNKIPYLIVSIIIVLLNVATLPLHAQDKAKKEWYFSWGYNSELWLPSNIQVSQNATRSNYTVTGVAAHDQPDWTTGIFNKPLAEPQYNIRIGCFFNQAHTRGWELSFDHTKYTVTENQTAHITGLVRGVYTDQDVVLTHDYFSYVLHNGANHLMLNYVQRIPLLGQMGKPLSLQGVLKTGAGIMLPHAENRIMGESNDVGAKEPSNWVGIGKGWWRYGGYTAGLEYGLRFAPVKQVFIELTNKIAYANLSDIPIAENGIARQELWMMEGIGSIGVVF